MNEPGTQTSIPGTGKRGRVRQYKNTAARVRAYRKRQKARSGDLVELRCKVSIEAKWRLRQMMATMGISEREALERLIQSSILMTVEDDAEYSVKS